ncbi:hypothetical protein MMC12_002169 [Toensbergia leucococca]|nr:hypothetical protein [Toensbergia leucococca]
MDVPLKWQSGSSISDTCGHQDHGSTIAVHSLAVSPPYQRQGLGQTIMKFYTQRMESAGIAGQVALLAHDHLICFYERLGFENKGLSEAKFGGGEWNNMVYEFLEGRP